MMAEFVLMASHRRDGIGTAPAFRIDEANPKAKSDSAQDKQLERFQS